MTKAYGCITYIFVSKKTVEICLRYLDVAAVEITF